jgi:hypothetical protein
VRLLAKSETETLYSYAFSWAFMYRLITSIGATASGQQTKARA